MEKNNLLGIVSIGDVVNHLIAKIKELRQLCWREAGVNRSARGMHNALLQPYK